MTDCSDDSRKDRSEQLQILLSESAVAREDDRYDFAQFAAISGVALALILALAALFYQTYPIELCTQLKPPSASYCKDLENKHTAIPALAYVGAPLVPVLLICYAVIVACNLTLRSYYSRKIERKIHEITQQMDDPFPIPSWSHLQLQVNGQSRSGPWIRPLWILMYLILLAMMGGCVWFSFHKIPDQMKLYQGFAIAVDVLAVLPFVVVFRNTVAGHRHWELGLAGLPERLRRTDQGFPGRHFLSRKARGERSLASFIFLPRNQEELVKALFIPISFTIGRLLCRGIPSLTSKMGWHLLAFFFVFEFLVYQARYLYNDLKDRRIDCTNKLSKRRFPRSLIDDPRAIAAVVIALITRLLSAVVIVIYIFPNNELGWCFGLLIGVLAVAFPYEYVRSKCNNVKSEKARRVWTWVLLVVVGLGYGLRAFAGLWLAGIVDRASLGLVTAGASLFGSTFVALGWALESTRGEGRDLDGKAHFVLLRSFVSESANRLDTPAPVNPEERVLSGRQSPMAPWCVFAFFGTAFLAGFSLHSLRIIGSIGLGMSIISIAATIAAIVVLSPIRIARIVTVLSILIGAAAGFVGILRAPLTIRILQSVTAVLVISLPLVVTCTFRSMRYADLPQCIDKFIDSIQAACLYCFEKVSSLYNWFIKER